MIKILRWLSGYTEFKIEGNTDKFISKFRSILWEVKKSKGKFHAYCLTKNYKKIELEAGNYESVLTKVHDFGFLNFLRKYVLRKGLVVGFIVFLFGMLNCKAMCKFLTKKSIEFVTAVGCTSAPSF